MLRVRMRRKRLALLVRQLVEVDSHGRFPASLNTTQLTKRLRRRLSVLGSTASLVGSG